MKPFRNSRRKTEFRCLTISFAKYLAAMRVISQKQAMLATKDIPSGGIAGINGSTSGVIIDEAQGIDFDTLKNSKPSVVIHFERGKV